MRLRLVAPAKRKDSANLQFEQRIPADLKERLVGMRLEFPLAGEVVPITITDKMRSIRFSLRANEAGEVRKRQAEAVAYLESVYQSLRADTPASLTHRQCVALSGELYRSWASDVETTSSISFQFEADGSVARDYGRNLEVEAAALIGEATKAKELEGADLERHLGPLVDRLLLRRGIAAVDASTRDMLLPAFAQALAQGMEASARKAQLDYRPDPNSERFPEWRPPVQEIALPARTSVSLRGLFDAWWTEAERAGKSVSTKESFGGAMDALTKFLAHDDALQVSPEDAVRFKDHLFSTINPRTKKPLSVQTIGGSYVGGLKVIFKWAFENKRLPSNPFSEVKVAKGKRTRNRETWFTPEERKTILENASATVRRKRDSAQRFAGRRWVPWLCAYGGARVGEMVQLRKEDIRQKDGHWVMTITPEAGTVKAGGMRDVPIHEHLVAMGFLEFVRQAPDGHLFMWSGDGRSAWRTAKNRIREEIRTVVKDPNVQPNHAWRHTFKTIGREVGIQDYLLDAITGHAPRTEGDKYGGATIKAKAAAMDMFPRYVAIQSA